MLDKQTLAATVSLLTEIEYVISLSLYFLKLFNLTIFRTNGVASILGNSIDTKGIWLSMRTEEVTISASLFDLYYLLFIYYLSNFI